jgi:hypothetical protein
MTGGDPEQAAKKAFDRQRALSTLASFLGRAFKLHVGHEPSGLGVVVGDL